MPVAMDMSKSVRSGQCFSKARLKSPAQKELSAYCSATEPFCCASCCGSKSRSLKHVVVRCSPDCRTTQPCALAAAIAIAWGEAGGAGEPVDEGGTTASPALIDDVGNHSGEEDDDDDDDDDGDGETVAAAAAAAAAAPDDDSPDALR